MNAAQPRNGLVSLPDKWKRLMQWIIWWAELRPGKEKPDKGLYR